MLIEFFFALRTAGIPVSITEFLMLLNALAQRLAFASIDDFYCLARTVLIKDEKYFDRYDQVFAAHVQGLDVSLENLTRDIPEDWLKKLIEKHLSEAEKEQLAALDWHTLMDTLRQRLAEQHERHQGGNKWIGTGGTSPFGAYGYHPSGVRIGQDTSRHRQAVKVWDQREFRDYDDQCELGSRDFKLALRRLRQFAREGALSVLDLDATINATAKNGGYLDLQLHAEPHNATKVLLFLDVGGSMDEHVALCDNLFSAVRSEFKHLEHFYFHNCVYETMWRSSARRQKDRHATLDVLHTFGADYKVIIVGDAAMSPYELLYPGASVEHMNEDSGETWLKRVLQHYPHSVWINPLPEAHWEDNDSTRLIKGWMKERMYPLSVAGLDQAARKLKRKI